MDFGLFSSALAMNSVTDTGSSGGGYALFFILAGGITFGFAWAGYKKWRRRNEDAEAETAGPPG